jgi:hypothetical protein
MSKKETETKQADDAVEALKEKATRGAKREMDEMDTNYLAARAGKWTLGPFDEGTPNGSVVP